MSEEEWENEVGAVEPPKGPVATTRELLASKDVSAREDTPEGMEFIGWELNGWVATYTLMDGNARPVYAFPREKS